MSPTRTRAPLRSRSVGPAKPVEPMLATPAKLPIPAGPWAFEYKWDGIRACVAVAGGRIAIVSRNGNDVTATFPEVAAMADEVEHGLVLDGEIVALNEAARPDFELLQTRLGVDARKDEALQRRVPCHFFAFDLLSLDGVSLLEAPYEDRRRRLELLKFKGDAWSVPPGHPGPAAAALAASEELGLEGIVAKRRDSRYAPGRRSDAWLKLRNVMRQEFVVGGWTEGEGARHGTLGAVLVGYYTARGGKGKDRLVYAGKVGTGFGRDLAKLHAALQALGEADDPFLPSQERVDEPTHLVPPQLVVDVEFRDVTSAGILRHASYKGVRTDKAARDVVWEQLR